MGAAQEISTDFLTSSDFPLYEWQLAHSQTPSFPNQYITGMK
jgi:hypothetical protein